MPLSLTSFADFWGFGDKSPPMAPPLPKGCVEEVEQKESSKDVNLSNIMNSYRIL